MLITGMFKGEGKASIEFGTCSLACEFCAYRFKESRDLSMMEVLEFVADPKIKLVHLGGMEPTMYGESLIQMLERLVRMKKRVELKTNGSSPDIIRRTLGLVGHYILEFNYPLNDPIGCSSVAGVDPEAAEEYLEHLRGTLDILQGHSMTVWMRAIPGSIAVDKVDVLSSQLDGKTDKIVLQQYLLDERCDAPFQDYRSPMPDEGQLVIMGRELLHATHSVSIRGTGFFNDFRAER